MRLITDRPDGVITAKNFVCMGVVEDNMKRYACLLDLSTGKIYIEEVFWTAGVRGNIVTAQLAEVADETEWKAVYRFVTEKTTILSPKKLRLAIQIGRSRGVTPAGVDSVIRQNFPYAKRQIDETKKHEIPLPPTQ